jgi:8-oxo-dGTP pyrophosphatase MutT (NUDIX family)
MSDYVRGLREKIGTDFLLMPSVAALIRDEEGRILLVQHVEGRWQLPGGAVDPGERPSDAIRRECREEAGIEIGVGELLGVFGGPEFSHTYGNGDEIGYVPAIFSATIVSGTPAASDDETRAVGWFLEEELGELTMLEGLRAVLREVLARRS